MWARLAGLLLLLLGFTAITEAFQGDVFQVQSVTNMGGGRYDVKLLNERTHYIHSETVVIDIAIGLAVGDIIRIITDSAGRKKVEKVTKEGPSAGTPSEGPTLPAGAVATGDPDAPDAGARGFVGSFPGTKNKWGSYCYTYLCEKNIWDINPLPTNDPNSVGHPAAAAGDVAIVYRKLSAAQTWVPVHFAIYQGGGIFFQRNGASSVEVVNSQFFSNFPNAIVRYVTPSTGK